MPRRFVIIVLGAIGGILFAADRAAACPDGQYEFCTIGCVCLPDSSHIGSSFPQDVRPVVDDPVKLIVNPASFINKTGIPTPGDFVEYVVKNPDKAIELLQYPNQWPYIPVATAIVAARNAVMDGGGQPMPADIRAFLGRWYAADLMDSIRWTTRYDLVRNTLQSIQMWSDSNTQAITVINAVVFRNGQDVGDRVLWAHELYHAQQYREWGVFGFAKAWVDNSSGNGPVEAPAYAREAEVRATLNQMPSGAGTGATASGLSAKLPSGTGLSACACWGPVAPNYRQAVAQCASGYAGPQACQGFGVCVGGALPWRAICQ